MDYLKNYGLTDEDIMTINDTVSDEVYSDLTFFKGLVSNNIDFLRDFGVSNYAQVIVKYPEIFLRDLSSLKNVLEKFDRDDLIEKVANNPTVHKKMVKYVDNN